MKKLLSIICFILLANPVFSMPVVENPLTYAPEKPLEATATLDWFAKNQQQRDDNIQQIKNILFTKDTITKYKKKDFKLQYANYWKNKNFLTDYDEVSHGKKEDNEKYYCGFYLKNLMVAYGIQYKDNPMNVYYYDAMGHIRWIDVFSKNYPTFPYWSYQYYRNGKLWAAYYYVSDTDQYVFDSNKEFIGRWYRAKMYNRKAKVIMTRSNY